MPDSPQLLIADHSGKIFNVPFLEGCGMEAGRLFRLSRQNLRRVPPCSQLMMLPDRMPVGFDPDASQFVHLEENPLSPGQPCYPVAVFLTPGYTGTFSSAFLDDQHAVPLPLFAYTAVVLYREEFYAACVQVDRELRQDPRYMDLDQMRKDIKAFKKLFPKNRLVTHLENCACVNGCPAAKNFFLKRYEAPLPTSPTCNCQCLGCISYQPGGKVPVTQPRIHFVPSPEEIAEVALFHMQNVKDPVVSFGQGCEGEPLMAGPTIEKAIRLIRAKSSKGMINLNTNASKPDMIGRLFDAGLDSIRVSLNSTQEKFYHAYYNPRRYTFNDVVSSIKVAEKKRGFVSLNYLVMPGFTDFVDEYRSFRKFLSRYSIDMIQWRNLNFDPRRYFKKIKCSVGEDQFIGIKTVIREVHQDFPHVMKGYFNPGLGRIRRYQAVSGAKT